MMLNLLDLSPSCWLSVKTALVTSITLISIVEVEAFPSEDVKPNCHPSLANAAFCLRLNEVVANDDKVQLNPLTNRLIFADSDLSNDDWSQENDNDQESPQSSLEDYLNLINKLDDPQLKAEMLIKLGRQYHEINRDKKASEALNNALEVSKEVENKPSQILLMIEIAAAYIELQDLETASQILNDSLTATQEITAQPEAATLLIDLASKYEQIGNLEKAKTIWTEVEILMAKIKNPPPSFPFQPLPLDAQIRLGTNFSSANNTLLNFTVDFEASKRWERDKFDFNFSFLNNYDDSLASDDKNRIVLDLVSQYQHYLSEATYLFANLGYLKDDFSGEDSRFSYFTGVGFNLWRGSTPQETFDMQLGIGDLFQNSNIQNKDAPFPVFQYAIIFKNKLFIDWNLNQYFIFEMPVSNPENYLADSRTILTIPAINDWSVFTSLNLRYLGIPELDSPNLSVRFTAGLQYDF